MGGLLKRWESTKRFNAFPKMSKKAIVNDGISDRRTSHPQWVCTIRGQFGVESYCLTDSMAYFHEGSVLSASDGVRTPKVGFLS